MQSETGNIIIHTSKRPEHDTKYVKTVISRPKRERAGFPERLLRNTALACALLLGVLTLKNLDAPWSQAAVNGIETALTMRIDPDGSLGKLSFVRSIIPESTLVFLNISGSGCAEPADGDVIHKFSEGQPWTVYQCEAGSPVRSAMAGTVSAAGMMDNGQWCVMIDHGSGIETMYAFMDKPTVDSGDSVARGSEIGRIYDTQLYYEYRLNGKSVLPGTEAGD